MDLGGFSPDSLLEQRVTLTFEYPVVFCDGALDEGDKHLAWAITRREPTRVHPVVFCVDSGVHRAWPDLGSAIAEYCQAHVAHLELRCPPITVPGGEIAKNDPEVLADLLVRFADAKLDRHACVIAIGGGAVLDAVGYGAAIVHRGVRVVRLPTTVLAQNDAGVGVKNGVNAFDLKNFLGTFAPPFAVLNDARWLSTLSTRDIRAGLAEAVKVACIRDASFFDWLEANAALLSVPGKPLNEAIERCARLHLAHIRDSGDPFETGSARPLDYGHWCAHKLESLTAHELRHGEAVAIGMLVDAYYAERAGFLGRPDLERLIRLIAALGLPHTHPALEQRLGGQRAVRTGLEEFREHLGGDLTITLLKSIGCGFEVHDVDETYLEEAISSLCTQDAVLQPATA
jgi:3-dehydroquinate synthase